MQNWKKIIGVFVNMAALRNYPSGEKTFSHFLAEVKKNTLEALQNQEYPFEDLVEKVTPTRDAARNPLFDAAFALQDLDIPVLDIPGLKLTPFEHETGMTKFDLTVIAETPAEKLSFTVEYCTKLFKTDTIERFTGYFKELLLGIQGNPGKKIRELAILPDEEKKQLLVDFNYREREYPVNKTIHELFAEQVERTPDHIALVAQGAGREAQGEQGRSALCAVRYAISYSELNEKSHRLAYLLPELTAVKFDRDLLDYRDYHDGYRRSYRTYKTYISKKVYKSGDLARWQPDGNIEFLGRKDQQVKIRGFRIELGEIEQQLLKHRDITGAVVIVRGKGLLPCTDNENQDKYLCAYVVSAKTIKTGDIRAFLAQFLPGYMIPAFFIRLEKIPLTPNGKIDRKALPVPGLITNRYSESMMK
jgi:non-ribosomal peptide synthetase component F